MTESAPQSSATHGWIYSYDTEDMKSPQVTILLSTDACPTAEIKLDLSGKNDPSTMKRTLPSNVFCRKLEPAAILAFELNHAWWLNNLVVFFQNCTLSIFHYLCQVLFE